MKLLLEARLKPFGLKYSLTTPRMAGIESIASGGDSLPREHSQPHAASSASEFG